MQYMKYHMNNYRIHIIKTQKFKTITVKINFKSPIVKDEITIRRFLSDILLNSSKNFKTERELNIEVENLYNVSINTDVSRSGKYSILSYHMHLLNEKYTEKNMLQKSFDFLKELLFNPDVENNAFNKESFELVKKSLKEEIESFEDNPNRYSNFRLYEETNKDKINSYRFVGCLEDLENITRENLYEYYKKVINEDILDIFVIGDVKDEIKDIISEMIPHADRIKISDSHYLDYLDKKEEINEVLEEKDYNQSKLALALSFDKLNSFEMRYVIPIFNFIFGGGSESKLFQEVREKNSLCYYIGSSVRMLDRLIVLNAGIDNKSYDKTVKLIKECLEDMKKGKFTNEEIEKGKTIYINTIQEILDSPMSIINSFVAVEYLGLDFIEDRINEIKKVKKEQIVELANKIDIDTIFFLKGGA